MDYSCKYRTNHFEVEDYKKFMELASRLNADEVMCSEYGDNRGRDTVILGEGGICISDGEDGSYEDGIGEFYKELQKILPVGEAAIFMEIGSEGFRYLTGSAVIVTRDTITSRDLEHIALDAAREALGNKDYTTQMTY